VSQGELTMTVSERDRLRVMQALDERRMRQRQAAEELDLTVRQVKRLLARYRREGDGGVVSRRRGRPSNRRLAPATRDQALEWVRSHYADFGPTLACEKLRQKHDLHLSVESLRQLMIGAGLWTPRRERVRIHAPRDRRPCFGELIQIDGSPHDWFEGRGPRCTLIVFIDDATSWITAAHFAPVEATTAYFATLQQHLAARGRPTALYSDRHSIFRCTAQEPREPGQTQFERALEGLEIQHIAATSPQAKGRVERANRTLQDRLVKALRLAGIDDLEAANRFLPGYLAEHNQQFAVTPADPRDVHRPVVHTSCELDTLLCRQYSRQVDHALCIQFENQRYQIERPTHRRRMAHCDVTVVKAADDTLRIQYHGKDLPFRLLKARPEPPPVASRKTLDQALDTSPAAHKPASDHPWRRPAVPRA